MNEEWQSKQFNTKDDKSCPFDIELLYKENEPYTYFKKTFYDKSSIYIKGPPNKCFGRYYSDGVEYQFTRRGMMNMITGESVEDNKTFVNKKTIVQFNIDAELCEFDIVNELPSEYQWNGTGFNNNNDTYLNYQEDIFYEKKIRLLFI